MRRLTSLALTALLGSLGCRKAPPPPVEALALAPPPADAASAVAPTPPELTLSSSVDVAGLRVKSGTIAGAQLWGFSDLGVDLRDARLEIARSGRGAPLAKLLPQDGLAVVNGGYFEADFRPSTWLKSRGAELAPKTDTSKGGLLAVGAAGLYVGAFSGLGFDPELAIQSHPLIVEPEGKRGIHRDDGRRAARTVACLKGSALHFIVISAARGEGPTLFESADLLRAPAPRGFGCTRALNLDGGPSTGVYFGPSVPARQREPVAPVAYAIAIVPR